MVKAEHWDNVIQGADESVQSWMTRVVGDLAVASLGAPSSQVLTTPSARAEVKAYLLGFAPSPPTRDQRSAPLQFQTRYLITVWGETQEQEHRILSRLILAALSEREDELDLVAPSLELWRALTIAPRPAFWLSIPVRVNRAVEEAPFVRDVRVRPSPIVALSGRVVGDGDVPIAGAVVSNTAINVTTRTDQDGNFRFPTAPGGDTVQTLTIHARGRSKAFSVKAAQGRGEPVLFRFAMKEG